MPNRSEQKHMPNAANHTPDPTYLRSLLDRAGVTQSQAAELLGVSPRMMRYYLAEEGSTQHRAAPYLVQFGLECLARTSKPTKALTINSIKRSGGFVGMTAGHALAFRFCQDVENGVIPDQADLSAIARGLKPITESCKKPTAEIMAEVAKRLDLTKDQGKFVVKKSNFIEDFTVVVNYLLRVRENTDAGQPLKEAEFEARQFFMKKLGIGDRAMRNRIETYRAKAEQVLGIPPSQPDTD
jgi:hypothetical protein